MPKLTDALVAELDQEASITRRVLERVPNDQLAWAPHARSMSLGRLALHVANIQGFFGKALREDSLDITKVERGNPEPASASELVSTFEKNYGIAKEFLNGLDDSRAVAPWSFLRDGKVMVTGPRIAMIRVLMLNHQYHHRGQLSVYLRLLNIPVPPIYGPSADENPFA